MSLTRTTRRSGLTLVALGLLGVVFFWVTDPHFGPGLAGHYPWFDPRHWVALLRGAPSNTIDAVHEAAVATLVGVAGSVAVLLIGLWLLARQTV
jgi:hypothetical protein